MRTFRFAMEILRTIAATFIAATLFFASQRADAQSAFLGPSTFSQEAIGGLMVIHFAAWTNACELTKADCNKYTPPRVTYAILPAAFGAFRSGTDVVFIDLRLLGQQAAIPVMVHEMVHYIQDRREPLKRPMTNARKCRDEKEAHDLAIAFVALTGIAANDPRIRSWDNAKYGYGCVK